jgi:hypothetical protein
MNYYSPELVRYIQGTGGPKELREASDIFALGLIYAEYLTGSVPAFDPSYHEPAIAVLNGERLTLGASGAPAPVVELVEQMMLADPSARPTVAKVHADLMGLRSAAPTTRGRVPEAIRTPLVPRDAVPPAVRTGLPGTPPRPGVPSALKGKGVRIADASRTADAPTPAATAATATGERTRATARGRGRALFGKLLGRSTDRTGSG